MSNKKNLSCPQCESEKLYVTTETENLANTNYWICRQCGHKFRTAEEAKIVHGVNMYYWLFGMIGAVVAEHFFGSIPFLSIALWVAFGIFLILFVVTLFQFIKAKKG